MIQEQEIFSIQRISSNDTSKYAIICISGFLSEGEDEKEMWKAVVESFPDAQVFALKYSSTKLKEFVGSCFLDLYSIISKFLPISFYLPLLNLSESNAIKQFELASKNAVVTGKLLAICIALGMPLPYESISLFAFSLGTKVITTCVHYLNKLHVYHKIHDIILMGGATAVSKKIAKYSSYFQVANGKVFNCYSKKDWVLYALSVIKNITLIGSGSLECYSKSLTEKALIDTGKAIENICLTEFVPGHLKYRDKLFNILEIIFSKYI